MANIITVQAQLTIVLIKQENAKRQKQRVLAIAEKGVVSKPELIQPRTCIDSPTRPDTRSSIQMV